MYPSLLFKFALIFLFLDILKGFDKVWLDGLLFKLRKIGILEKLKMVLHDFLTSRKQRVVLNGKQSSWKNVNPSVPQGSILGPLLFLIYTNDLPEGLQSNPKLQMIFLYFRQSQENQLNEDLIKINNLKYKQKLIFNPDPSKRAQEVTFQ